MNPIKRVGDARRDGIKTRQLADEKVGNYDTIKIAASYIDPKLKEMKMVFYAAPALQNLVIADEMSMGEKVKFIVRLNEVSLAVSEQLFEIPEGYKKVVVLNPKEEIKKRVEELRRKVNPASNNSRKPQ